MSMKKVLFIIAVICFFVSCVNQPRISKTNDPINLEKFIDDFRSRYPKGLDNDAQRETMNEAFKKEVTDSLSKSSWLFEKYPLRCRSVLKHESDSSLCYVHFQSWIQPRNFSFKNSNLHEVGFDIVATASAKYIDLLKEDNYYFVKGKLIDFIPNSVFKIYTNDMAYTPRIGISPEVGIGDRFNVNFGMMLFEIEDIELYDNY